MNFTQSELRESDGLEFSNEHNPEAEEILVEIEERQLASWDNPFKVWVNGELTKTFKSFSGMKKHVQGLIEQHDLRCITVEPNSWLEPAEMPDTPRNSGKSPFDPF